MIKPLTVLSFLIRKVLVYPLSYWNTLQQIILVYLLFYGNPFWLSFSVLRGGNLPFLCSLPALGTALTLFPNPPDSLWPHREVLTDCSCSPGVSDAQEGKNPVLFTVNHPLPLAHRV